jgi:hypothetical protein
LYFLQTQSQNFTDKECMIRYVHILHVNYPFFLSDFKENGIFSTFFRKILKYEFS